MQQIFLAGVLCSSLALLSSCGSSGSGSGFASPTFIEVSPTEFQGVECAVTGGEWVTYTATLLDVTGQPGTLSAEYHAELEKARREDPTRAEDDPIQAEVFDYALPTSPPTGCQAAVRFAEVVPAGRGEVGHSYVAHLAGYDRAGLEPVAPGSPLLTTQGKLVKPRWEGTCGVIESAPGTDSGSEYTGDAGVFRRAFDGAVEPQFGRTVRLRNCQLREVAGTPAR